MRRIFIIIITVAILGLGGIFLTRSSAPSSSNNENQSQNRPSTSQDTSEQTAYTKEQVAEHSSASDCWTIIDGTVYDITSYIPRHDGGDEILRACGTDATSLFRARQTTDGQAVGSGTPHSGMAQSHLDRLKIGTLSQE